MKDVRRLNEMKGLIYTIPLMAIMFLSMAAALPQDSFSIRGDGGNVALIGPNTQFNVTSVHFSALHRGEISEKNRVQDKLSFEIIAVTAEGNRIVINGNEKSATYWEQNRKYGPKRYPVIICYHYTDDGFIFIQGYVGGIPFKVDNIAVKFAVQ